MFCNANGITDDILEIKLNGHLLGTKDMIVIHGVTPDCPRIWWSTDARFNAALVISRALVDPCCLADLADPDPLDPSFLVAGTNRLQVHSINDNGSQNYGNVWLWIYQMNDDDEQFRFCVAKSIGPYTGVTGFTQTFTFDYK